MDTANWPRVNFINLKIIILVLIYVPPLFLFIFMELGVVKSNPPLMEEQQMMEMKKPAAKPPHKEQALNCPRCNSTNTKFCYYNNYSLTQPRYFCKTCRRYWTEGGSLRNVPVGGGSRKNKRSNPNPNPNQNPTTAPAVRKLVSPPDHLSYPPTISVSSSQNPKFNEAQDLNLAFPQFDAYPNPNPNPSMELFKGSNGMQFMTSGMYPTGYGMPQTLSFPLHGGGYESLQGVQESSGRMLFPFEDLKPAPSNNVVDQFDQQNRGQGGEATGYWNNMIGGGGTW